MASSDTSDGGLGGGNPGTLTKFGMIQVVESGCWHVKIGES